ncbi:molybdenum cofactor synthesis domain protein [Desulfosporosinus orientis DSM 765]|uniref:Molybdopterin molybdenumtransferase n=1 Tax=Desulfosporosinus orientis (strain ATCC 19365 / DSM 765 / NCIMB 8382 / VKM B-1628 / Singapore I) TaxID=768706 RepID=G7WHG4_DESOD|nr:gephyrin-like molybdotransferase Glp [Desulfosporosinus orientis]AET70254.1 molybdenum cofactor synthesis domain protein [Desulfosporosinus orientis DSM 765]
MKTMIDLEEALQLVLDRIQPVDTECVGIADGYFRVLAEDVVSQIAMPPFARSPLDGYAYIATDTDPRPLQLKVVAEIPAGTFLDRVIDIGEAVKIFTGAPIPSGANCVVRMEDTEAIGDKVRIFRPVAPGSNIVHKGEEIKGGDVLLRQGFYLTPPAVGLLAAVGLSEIKVYRRPRVGLLSSGSELMDVGQPLNPGKIYNSNSYTLRGMLQQAGCEVLIIPIVNDQIDDTLEALRKVVDADIIITTGGASVGDYDIIRDAFAEYGCEMLFWKLNLKPGTPASVGQKGNQFFFSLSGNPAAAMVTFELLVRPALRKFAGRRGSEEVFPVKMASAFNKGGKQRRFLRARAVFKDGEICADLSPAQGSGILRSMIGSHLLIDVPANHGAVEVGELMMARWITDWET